MVQAHFLFSWVITVAVLSFYCDNCNAEITEQDDIAYFDDMEGFDLDEFGGYDLEDLDKMDPRISTELWLKRKVRQLLRRVASLEETVEEHETDIENNANNINDNANDIRNVNETVLDNTEAISNNTEAFENFVNITNLGVISDLIMNNSKAIAENSELIANNTMDIEENSDLVDMLKIGHRQYLTFGGFDADGSSTDAVYLVDVHVPYKISRSCVHSTLPFRLKESHVFEYNDTLLVCTTFTEVEMKALQCFTWDSNLHQWQNFSYPPPNPDKFHTFIETAVVKEYPDSGGQVIYFSTIFETTNTGNYSMVLWENGTWEQDDGGLAWTNSRNRACLLAINDTTLAHIGGTTKPANADLGETIDIWNFETGEQSLNVSQLHFNRKMHMCALIPEGPNGNPTVAILGDNSSPFPFEMELWDTVTNEVTLVDHPPGYNESRFFRPTMATWDSSSIILAGAEVWDDDGESQMVELLQYKIEDGVGSWIDLGEITPELQSKSQYDIYMLDNPDLGAYESLISCP